MSRPSASTVPLLGVTIPQTMLMSVVLPAPLGTEQGEDLAPANFEIDVLQRPEARSVGLGQTRNGDDGRHRREFSRYSCATVIESTLSG